MRYSYDCPRTSPWSHGSALFDAIETGDLWPGFLVALALGVTPDNCRARRLYKRLGFSAIGTSMVRRATGGEGRILG